MDDLTVCGDAHPGILAPPERNAGVGRRGGVCHTGGVRLALCLATLLLFVMASAPVATAGNVWADATGTADESDYDAAMRMGDAYAERAALLYRRSSYRARSFAHRAIEAYERAIKLDPKSAEAHFRAAEILHAHYVQSFDHPEPEKAERAIAHWRAFEKLAPLDPRLVDVLIRRSIDETKLATETSLRAAVADYERILDMLDEGSTNPADLATWTANVAEIHMMLGEMGTAIDLYERALNLEARPLYAYGLAVALDRDHQGARAREVMRSFALTDQLRELSQPGVFFVPRGEIYYYLGLGNESLGHRAKAVDYYKKFIASGAHPEFQDRARENIRALNARAQKP